MRVCIKTPTFKLFKGIHQASQITYSKTSLYPLSFQLHQLHQQRTISSEVITRVKDDVNAFWNGTKSLWKDWREVRAIKSKEVKTLKEETRTLTVATDIKSTLPILTLFVLPIVGYSVVLVPAFFPSLLPKRFLSQYRWNIVKTNLQQRQQTAKQTKIREAMLDYITTSTIDPMPEVFTLLDSVKSSDKLDTKLLAKAYFSIKESLQLDFLPRPYIGALCQFINLPVNWLLPTHLHQYKLMKRIEFIQKTDKLLMTEGIGELTNEELEQLLLMRGLPIRGNTATKRKTLKNYLKFSRHMKLPSRKSPSFVIHAMWFKSISK